MAPREERSVKQQDVIPMLRQEFAQIAGARVFAAPYPMVQGARGEPLQFVLTGDQPAGTRPARPGPAAQAGRPARLGRIDTDLQLDLPQLIFSPDRLRIADAGLATQDVALAINMLTGGVDIAKFNDEPGDGQRYDIRVKAVEGSFTQPADLSKIYLRNKAGEMVRLDSVASFRETLGPAVVGRFDLQYATTFFATPTLPWPRPSSWSRPPPPRCCPPATRCA
jgi:HAE1 family hydrophobic/amphiphilic exporter-1